MHGESIALVLANWRMPIWTIVVGVVCAIPCAVLGCFLVLRRMSLLGDAISHAVLPGIVLAFLFSGQLSGIPVIVGAMALGVLTSMLTEALHHHGKVAEDASMGVVFTSLFAAGVILLNQVGRRAHLDADCVLYGLIEFVSEDTVDMLGMAIPRVLVSLAFTFAATVVFTVALWKELKIASFDPTHSTSMGINAGLMHYLLMAMVAGVTVASFEAVGSILVIAMLIVPAATAHLLTDRLFAMVLYAAAVAVISAVTGYLLADALNTSVAGMMAVTAGAQFGAAVFLAPRHGVAAKLRHNLLLALRVRSEDVLALLFRAEESQGNGGTSMGLPRPLCIKAAGEGLLAAAALRRLKRKREAESSPDGRFRLTESGRERARSLVRAHRLWEAYLSEHSVLPIDHLHEPASRIEHFLGPDLQREIANSLTQTDQDPHGKPIPPTALRDQNP